MINDALVRMFDWLTPRVLTERFQFWHLVINYSILALGLLLYLVGVIGTGSIFLFALPGAFVFVVSLQCLGWRMDQNDENPLFLLMNLR
jgi:hypothetical protein